MSAKHHLHTAASIPSHLTPAEVIAALQDHETTLSLQAFTTGHEKLSSTAPEVLKDNYWFPTDLHPVETYSVTECVTFLPGVGQLGKKNITFPSCYQNVPTGIKTCATVSGVTVRADFRVIKSGTDGEVKDGSQGSGDAEWVLVEDAEVSCSALLMPFVKGKMEEAHRNICRKVIEKIEKQRREVGAVQTGEQGQQSPPRHAIHADSVTVEADANECQRFEMHSPGSQKIYYA